MGLAVGSVATWVSAVGGGNGVGFGVCGHMGFSRRRWGPVATWASALGGGVGVGVGWAVGYVAT